MFEWITGIIEKLGYAGIALLMLLENIFPPIPSELIMPLGGFLAHQDKFTSWAVIAAGTVGTLLGAVGWYYVGHKIGEKRVREWVGKHGRWLTISCQDLDKAKDKFDRHQARSILIGRLIPGIRTFVSLPAGFAKMSFLPFLLYTTVGSVLWVGLLTMAGRLLGANYDKVEKYMGPVTWVILGGIAAMYLWRVIRHKGPGKGEQQSCEPPASPGRRPARAEAGSVKDGVHQ